MKRIVIFCDGTWNHLDEITKGIPAPTNVVKLAEDVSRIGNGILQQVYYDAGIGSSGSMIQRVYDAATGSGISAKILQAYRFLIQQFEIGDELFLFGFSRGAFTVRSLAGLIRNCGILRRDALYILPGAIAQYRSQRPASHPRLL